MKQKSLISSCAIYITNFEATYQRVRVCLLHISSLTSIVPIPLTTTYIVKQIFFNEC